MNKSTNPLRLAIRQAKQDQETLRTLFDELGNKEKPNTRILASYRTARRGLALALKEKNRNMRRSMVYDLFSALKGSVKNETKQVLERSTRLGKISATNQLSYYQTNLIDYNPNRESIDSANQAISRGLDTQESAIMALIESGASEALILGDKERVGALRPMELITAAALYATLIYWQSFSEVAQANNWKAQKQAIAGLDERTTECCLLAHAQIVNFEGMFKLVGTPRYADELPWTPFHRWCRTSIALYNHNYEDGITQIMRDGADRILEEREAGGSGYRHPASAQA